MHRGRSNGSPLDLPLHTLGGYGAIAPLIVAGWGKGCRVAACVGGRGLSSDSQLGAVVAVPGGALRRAGIGQAPALRGGLDNGGPAYRPGDFLRGVGVIAPSVALFGGEGGDIVASIGAFDCAANGQGFRVITVPVRALFAASIGQAAVLSRNRINGMGQLRDGLQSGIRSSQGIGSVCPCLGCYLCRVARCFQCFRGLFIRIFRSFRCSSGGLAVLVGLLLHRMGIVDHLLHHGVDNRAGPHRVGVLDLTDSRRVILRAFRDCVKLFCHELSPPG